MEQKTTDISILSLSVRSIAGGFLRDTATSSPSHSQPYEIVLAFRRYGEIVHTKCIYDFEATPVEVTAMIDSLICGTQV
jgi:hypothetical protein